MSQTPEALATRFVNLTPANVADFHREHQKDIRAGCQAHDRLTWIIQNLREAWTYKDADGMLSAEKIIRELLFDARAARLFGRVLHVEETPYPNVSGKTDPFTRPAFVLRLGDETINFERRDILDDIAHTIFKAAARGLLRTCRGHSQGWGCPTPFLVADEKRRVYCYMRCGDEAKSRAKAKWWRDNRSRRQRKRSARKSLARRLRK